MDKNFLLMQYDWKWVESAELYANWSEAHGILAAMNITLGQLREHYVGVSSDINQPFCIILGLHNSQSWYEPPYVAYETKFS